MARELKGDLDGAGLRIAIVVARFNEHVTSLLLQGALDGLAGFVRPVSLILTPLERDGTPVVRGRYVCEAVSFNVPEVLSSITGGDHNGQ